MFRSVSRYTGFAALVFFATLATAQVPPSTSIAVAPGESTVLATAICVQVAVAPKAGKIEISKTADGLAHAIYTAPPTATTDAYALIKTGPKSDDCETASQAFQITVGTTPQVPEASLGVAFRVLMGAFVIAMLLESAFALLFNWRPFQEFFVGKTWHPLIMFGGALMIVRTLHLDLMASLFDAYAGSNAESKGGWFTSVLTAMVLAGGSAGVNRMLVGLGFRAVQAPPPEPRLNDDQAWVAVQVDAKAGAKAVVNITEEAAPAGDQTPAIAGALQHRSLGERFRQLWFPQQSRVPRSGGRTVSTDKRYRISVEIPGQDGNAATFCDYNGKAIASADKATALRFASRAVVDLYILPPPPTS